jgi:hypothetical protein
MKRVLQLLFLCVLAAVVAQPAYAAQKRVHAKLSGSQEVPKVKTGAKGTFTLLFYQDALSFELNVDGIMNPTGAYIHLGKKGENGPAIAGLFAGPAKEGLFNGILAQGAITPESLLGEFQGKPIADLVRLLKSGNAYVNIQTETFPDGEIRGQIK